MSSDTDQSGIGPAQTSGLALRIAVDDLTGPEIAALLTEHLTDMAANSPAESMHALDLDALRRPEITFWSGWDGAVFAGCAALKELDAEHAEIKSMRTAATHKRRGVASILLRHLLAEATARGYRRVSLETGTPEFFEPAQKLYAAHGFVSCPPFGEYRVDPYSTFMTRQL
ncbi:GNAT family N-acetyltransferase [Nocardia brasiliensis]|uniref:GNAT family N-acetyltransferase n=1 Tax=Nocardia brasiliensis TaxID=37326 RepID=UPI0024589D48|nr:GNAT family N-acetyltransferase [Nocardia brasiliensis]